MNGSSSSQARAMPNMLQSAYDTSEQQGQQKFHSEPSSVLTDLKPTQGSPRKLTSIQQGVTSVPKGKPRIFAAMEAFEGQENKQPPAPFINNTSHSLQGVHHIPTQGSHYLNFTSAEDVLTPAQHGEPLPLLFPSSSEQFSDQFASPSGHKPAPPSHVPISAHERVPAQVHSRRLSNTRSTGRQDELPRPSVSQTPPRTKKLSKARHPPDAMPQTSFMNGSPGTPESGQRKLHRTVSKNNLVQPGSDFEPVAQLDEETIRKAGIPLDDDPFARVEGVRVLNPSLSPKNSGSKKGDVENGVHSTTLRQRENGSSVQSNSVLSDSSHSPRKGKKGKDKSLFFNLDPAFVKRAPSEPVTATRLLLDAQVFACLLQFLSFYEWCILLGLSKEIRLAIVRTPILREAALERFLKTVGYSRWTWDDQEPLSLSLQVSQHSPT